MIENRDEPCILSYEEAIFVILAIEIANTHAVIGVYDKRQLIFKSRVSTDIKKTDDEYTIILQSLLDLYGVPAQNITGGIIGSVVPQMIDLFLRAIRMVCDVQALVVGPGIRTGLQIKVDQPGQLGANLVCAAVGAMEKYPAPLIVFDMGTATTVTALDASGTLIGGSIMPGVSIMLNSLVERTAQLPQISLDTPKKVIGTNTVDCMKSGIVYGTASMLDGMAERYRAEMGEHLTIIATGSVAENMIPHCKNEMIYDPSLLLDGLRILYEKNTQ